MSTHLTRSGIWLFASAVIFVTVGVISQRPFILLLGSLQVGAVAVAYLLCLASALSLDRRIVQLRVRDEDSPGEARTTGHVVGDQVRVKLALENHSVVPLFGPRLEAYAPEELSIQRGAVFGDIPSGTTAEADLTVTSDLFGRWMLHGFDVSILDPFGLVRRYDYLPCNHAFEFYPNIGRFRHARRRKLRKQRSDRDGARRTDALNSGTITRELREYQPGDPLRKVAWKPTARMRRLISREFEEETSVGLTVLLDISGSMRGGEWRGQKLAHAVEMVAGLADEMIQARNRVGLITFDEKVYGMIPSGSSTSHLQRILHHLIGLNSVVDADLTDLDDEEIEKILVEYLLVQERLDFRRGGEDDSDGINRPLLRRWVAAHLDDDRERFNSPVLTDGVVVDGASSVREFARLRGLIEPHHVESKIGAKGQGLSQAIRRAVHGGGRRGGGAAGRIVVVSDLCGVTNFDVVEEALSLAEHFGHEVQFLVPFTPSYYERDDELDEASSSDKHVILTRLFTAAERDERKKGVEFLRERGVQVDIVQPDGSEERRA